MKRFFAIFLLLTLVLTACTTTPETTAPTTQPATAPTQPAVTQPTPGPTEPSAAPTEPTTQPTLPPQPEVCTLHQIDPYVGVNKEQFYDNYTTACCYNDAMYRTQHFLLSGSLDVPGQYAQEASYRRSL